MQEVVCGPSQPAEADELTLVFVYGTLMMGEPNNHLLDDSAFLMGDETYPDYTMLDLGYFPGVVTGGTTTIKGEVYQVDADTLERLDQLESHPIFYRRTNIMLKSGRDASIYLLQKKYQDALYPCIPTGNWRTR